MKTLRMITCFLITSMFVFLLLIPGKAQASDLDGIWAVEVKTGPNSWYGTWIVGNEGNSIFGSCTWIDSELVNRLSGVLYEEDGEKKVKIVRTVITMDTFGAQTYEGTLNGNVIEGSWTGQGGCTDPDQGCSWSATIYEDRTQIVPFDPGLVVDDSDANFGFIGPWKSWHCSGSPDCYNRNVHYLYIDESIPSGANWNAQIPIEGTYKVYACWLADENRSQNVTYNIRQNGITLGTVSDVDQRKNGGQWNELGEYQFAEGTAIVVLDYPTNASGYVIADAIKWERQ